MKNKLIASFSFLLMVVIVSSCATSRKYGCPTVTKVDIKNTKA